GDPAKSEESPKAQNSSKIEIPETERNQRDPWRWRARPKGALMAPAPGRMQRGDNTGKKLPIEEGTLGRLLVAVAPRALLAGQSPPRRRNRKALNLMAGARLASVTYSLGAWTLPPSGRTPANMVGAPSASMKGSITHPPARVGNSTGLTP